MYIYIINCCLSISIKLKINVIFFEILMKISKNTTNVYA